MKRTKLAIILFCCLTITTVAQPLLTGEDRAALTSRFEAGKLQYGAGLTLKLDLVKSTFGYFRVSITGGVGVPVGKQFNARRNILAGYYLFELDLFRGGIGAPALALDNQKLLMELRQSFLVSYGRTHGSAKFNFTRPLMHFVSNSSHPLFDPYNASFTIGTTFINGINIRRSQRTGIASAGIGGFMATYLNDGPPFTADWLPFGDGFDRWWTGSGMVGYYSHDYRWFRSLELKYDKITGLQPYAYETATALKLKHIPYKLKEAQLYNRQRIEFGITSTTGIGYSGNWYDYRQIDIQHRIHSGKKFSYHDTPLMQRFGSGPFYTNTFRVMR